MTKNTQIISQAEAKAAGLKRYFTGKPCPFGHITERKISGGCLECLRIKSAEFRATEEGKRYYSAYSRKPEVRARAKSNLMSPARKAKKAAADAARYARPEVKERVAAFNATPEGRTRKRKNWHRYKYKEPGSTRFFRYYGQRCRDDLSGGEAEIDELHQDHDHATGAMRGLISGRNNSGIGFLDDSPLRCAQAATYLVRHAADDPDHPLLADQSALAAIKAEADRLSAMVAKLICPTKQNSTPLTSATVGPTKVLPFTAPNAKLPHDSKPATSSQNTNERSRRSA